MSNPPPPTRRVPPATPTSNVPPPFPAPSFTPRRKRRHVAVIAIAVVASLLLAGVVAIYRDRARVSAHEETVQTLQGQMQLEQQDSMTLDTWQGGISIDGTNYMLMSFRENNKYVKEFLQTLAAPAQALVMFIDNRNNSDKHTVDLTGAKLYFAGNVTRDVPDQIEILKSAKTNQAAALEAFPPVIQIPPEKLLWGKIMFVPPDTDPRKLSAVTVKIDSKPIILEGGFFTAAQKRRLTGDYSEDTSTTAPATSPATQPAP